MVKRETIKSTLSEFVELDKEQLDNLTNSLLNSFHEELESEKALTEAEKQKLVAKESELEEANKTIKSLKKNMQDPEEVAKQIESYEKTIADLQVELHNQEISAYEQNKLTLAGAQDIDICQLALQYDKSKIKSKDDYKLIDEAIEAQKKEKAFLYKSNEKESKQQASKQAPSYNPRVGNGRLNVEDSTGKDFAKQLSEENRGFLIQGVNK